MEKLRSRKAEVDDQLQRARSATQFAPPPLPTPSAPPADLGEPLLDDSSSAPAPSRPAARPSQPGLAPEQKAPEAESYTNRLLKAKQRVWEEREKGKDKS